MAAPQNITGTRWINDSLSGFIKRRFCGMFRNHRSAIWVRNVYGDEINLCGGCRSLWQCTYCGVFIYERELKGEE
jgi:hypothetical protein